MAGMFVLTAGWVLEQAASEQIAKDAKTLFKKRSLILVIDYPSKVLDIPCP